MINDNDYNSQQNIAQGLQNFAGEIVNYRGIKSLGEMTYNEKRCFVEAANDLDYYHSLDKKERREFIDDTIKKEYGRQYKSDNDQKSEKMIGNIYFNNQGDKDEI